MAKRTYVYDGSEFVGLASPAVSLDNYPNMTTTPISGFRNVIINGDFRINQRGLGSSGTVYTSGYGFDRWYVEANNGTLTHSAQTFTPGNAIDGYEPTSFARLTTSGQTLSGAYAALIQKIEDVRSLAGQTVTISFWAKAASGTPKVAIELDQQFGSGGSTRVTTLAGQVTLSTLWNRYSVTVQVPSISGKTIGSSSFIALDLFTSTGADFNARSGSLGIQNNTFDFWGIQMEKGSIATPFEQRPIGTEISLCQRYFQKSFPITTAPSAPAGTGDGTGNNLAIYNATVGNAYSGLIRFQTTMRRQPDVVLYNAETSAVGTWSIYNSSAQANNSYAVSVSPFHNGLMVFIVGVPSITVSNGAWTANAEL
jgi:hypothetical protein